MTTWTCTPAPVYVATSWAYADPQALRGTSHAPHHTTHHHQPIPPLLSFFFSLLVLGAQRKIIKFAGIWFPALSRRSPQKGI